MGVHYSLGKMEDIALALGFFDGVHLAHQKLISKTVSIARENGIKSVAITFIKSPYSFITGTLPVCITLLKDRIEQISALGIDEVFVLDFENIKNMHAKEYIDKILIRHFAPKFVLTGFNHTFGLNREGNSKLLRENFNYVELGAQMLDGRLISSTNIKAALHEGDIKTANNMLNRNFYAEGRVIKGAQIARQIGYHTANISWNEEIVRLKYGVYSGFAIYNGIKYPALINFGIRPSVDKELKETLEVHLEGFNGNLYGETIQAGFICKLRDEIKFSSLEELKIQIDKDFLKHHECAE